MNGENTGNKASDKKQELKHLRASLKLEFHSKRVKEEFVSLAEPQPGATRVPKSLLSLDLILPIPHHFRATHSEADRWLFKWASYLKPMASRGIEGHRHFLDPNTVIYHFDLRQVAQRHAVVRSLFFSFFLNRIELRQNVTGMPYHVHDGRICFIDKNCEHAFEQVDVKTHPGNIVYSICRPEIPHPIFQTEEAIEYLFRTNPETSKEDIQLSYIALIMRTPFWRWTSGGYEANQKSKLYKRLLNYLQKKDLEILRHFVNCGSHINLREQKEQPDIYASVNWKYICRDFLKVDIFFE